MKVVNIQGIDLEQCIRAAQKERVVLSRNGEPVAAGIYLKCRVPIDLSLAVRENVIDKFGEDGEGGALQRCSVRPSRA